MLEPSGAVLHLVGYDNGRKPSLWQINFPPEGKMTEGEFELSPAIRNSIAFPGASGDYFAVGHAGASEVVAALLDPQGLVHADFRGSGPIRMTSAFPVNGPWQLRSVKTIYNSDSMLRSMAKPCLKVLGCRPPPPVARRFI